MQSRRTRLPTVRVGVPAGEAMAGDDVSVADPGGAPPSLVRPVVLVGPEGGWSDAERSAAPSLVGLGPTVLRAETAAVAAGTMLAALRHGLVREAPFTQNTDGG
jgi:RsmE family RNA methyltransferase